MFWDSPDVAASARHVVRSTAGADLRPVMVKRSSEGDSGRTAKRRCG